MAQGLYRVRQGWDRAGQHLVQVRYSGGHELPMSEVEYGLRRFVPPFDQLPWYEEPDEADPTSGHSPPPDP